MTNDERTQDGVCQRYARNPAYFGIGHSDFLGFRHASFGFLTDYCSAIFCRSGCGDGAAGVAAASGWTIPIFFLYSWKRAAPRILRASCWREMPEPISLARSSVARIWP